MTILTLTTDFGESDGYVAAVRGVILGLAPSVRLVDVTHAIEPGGVRQGAYILSTILPYFPTDTVHVVVVDPGVGSSRRALAARSPWGVLVGPDNGLLPTALDLVQPASADLRSQVLYIHLNRPQFWRPTISPTFHGRDIFAPVAARLALGEPLTALGDIVHDPVTLDSVAIVTLPDGSLAGEVMHVDRFGNLITTITADTPGVRLVVGQTVVEVGGQTSVLARTYSDVSIGGVVAYIGSSRRLEVAVRQGNAAARLGVGVGTQVRVMG